MLQLTPQSRIFVATEPVDFRNYADSAVMPSPAVLNAWAAIYFGCCYA